MPKLSVAEKLCLIAIAAGGTNGLFINGMTSIVETLSSLVATGLVQKAETFTAVSYYVITIAGKKIAEDIISGREIYAD